MISYHRVYDSHYLSPPGKEIDISKEEKNMLKRLTLISLVLAVFLTGFTVGTYKGDLFPGNADAADNPPRIINTQYSSIPGSAA